MIYHKWFKRWVNKGHGISGWALGPMNERDKCFCMYEKDANEILEAVNSRTSEEAPLAEVFEENRKAVESWPDWKKRLSGDH
jgi:hypothetical protein